MFKALVYDLLDTLSKAYLEALIETQYDEIPAWVLIEVVFGAKMNV